MRKDTRSERISLLMSYHLRRSPTISSWLDRVSSSERTCEEQLRSSSTNRHYEFIVEYTCYLSEDFARESMTMPKYAVLVKGTRYDHLKLHQAAGDRVIGQHS